jgi:DUF1680 family protein
LLPITLILSRAASLVAAPVTPVATLAAEPFSPTEVTLLEGPFRQAQRSLLARILELDPDGILAYSRREAGLPPKGEPLRMPSFNFGGGVGHHLSACSLMWQTTRDPRLLERIRYLVAGLAECQRANGDGYCGGVVNSRAGFAQLKRGVLEFKPAGGFNGMEGVPWYNLHKIYAGLVDAYRRAGVAEARPVLLGMAQWCLEVTSALDEKTMQAMLSIEHGGMAEALADVYALTGDSRHLALARRFRDDLVFVPLRDNQDVLHRLTPPRKQTAGLHANTQIPKFLGYQRLFELTGERDYHVAALNFWRQVVWLHSYVIGGNSAEEHFFGPHWWDESIQHPSGPESCNTVNMLKLTARLFGHEPRAEFMDFYERALFNHVLAMVNPRTGGQAYFTSLCPMAYRVTEPLATSCCGFTVREVHFQAHELIYARAAGRLWVNQFIASEVAWTEQGVRLRQETRFPYEPRTTLRIQTDQPQRFTLSVRRPDWAGAEFAVVVNGRAAVVNATSDRYVHLERTWVTGDEVALALPSTLTVTPLGGHGRRFVAFQQGPIVLAASHGALDFPEKDRTGQKGQGWYGTPEEWPVVVGAGAGAEIVRRFQPVAEQPLHYYAPGLVRPQDLDFKPFFECANDRYSVYLLQMDEPSWTAEARRRAEAAASRRVLDARTIDQLTYADKAGWKAHGLPDDHWKTVRNFVFQGTYFWTLRPTRDCSLTFQLRVEPNADQEIGCLFWEGATHRHADRWQPRLVVEGAPIAAEIRAIPAEGRRWLASYPLPAALTRGRTTINVTLSSALAETMVAEVRTLRRP